MILLGDAAAKLRTLEAGSVHCCVTSPPYFGLRDYGKKGQIGLEKSVDRYIERLVEVFMQVHRVLRVDGTLWLNIGDSYGKSQELLGVPWRLVFALQEEGWLLRSDIIWAKGISFCDSYAGSVMPESVRNRPSKTHEYLFLLAKRPGYYYDNEAVKEVATHAKEAVYDNGKNGYGGRANSTDAGSSTRKFGADPGKRNLRSVWTISPKPFKGAHFAVMPEALVEPCIKAGTSEKVCGSCGAPFVRHKKEVGRRAVENYTGKARKDYGKAGVQNPSDTKRRVLESMSKVYEFEWKQGCSCRYSSSLDVPVKSLVLDPFTGSGTVRAVAKRLSRDFIGVELNPEYRKLALNRK